MATNYTPEFEKATFDKVAWRLIPFLFICYIVAFLDRVNVGFAAYYASMGRVDLVENHKDEKPVSISGKDVRNTLQKGELVDPRIMRESTSRILSEAMKQ